MENGELLGSVNNPEPDLADVLKATRNGIAALKYVSPMLSVLSISFQESLGKCDSSLHS